MASAKGQYHVGGSRGVTLFDSALTTQELNSSGDKIGTIFVAPDGSQPITHIDVYVTAIAGTSPTYRVVLQGYNATGGIPDGTDVGGGSPTLVTFQPVATGLHHLELTNGFTFTEGDLAAAVLEYDSGAIDGSNNATFQRSWSSSPIVGLPYCVSDTSGSWLKPGSVWPQIAPVFADGLIVPGCEIFTASARITYNSGSAADEIGNVWVARDGATCIGAVYTGRFNLSAANYDIVFYDSDSSVLKTVSIDGEAIPGTSGNIQLRVFWEGVSITGAATYRLLLKPTTINNININGQTYPNSAHRASHFGSAIQKTTRVDGGSFTDDDTDICGIFPILSDIEAGAGGLLVHPGTSGGARA